MPFDGPLPGNARESYRVTLAIIGAHADEDSFSGALIEFDRLDAWADAPSIRKGGYSRKSAEVQLEPVVLAELATADAEIALQVGIVGSVGDARVHLERSTGFEVKLNSPLPAEAVVQDYVRLLQDLLIFALGRVVKLTSLKLMPSASDPHQDYCDAYFNTVQRLEPEKETMKVSPWGYSEPTLLTVRNTPIPINEILSQWLLLRDAMPEVIVLLHAPFYAPFMYSENRFASAFQSAEALHRRRFDSQEKEKSVHAARVKAISDAATLANVDTEVVQWATRVLQARNDKPLRQRIEELIDSTGAIGAQVMEADPKFASAATYSRTGVSHGGSLSGVEQSIQRFWRGEVLAWIVRARLLMELGVPLGEVEKRVLSSLEISWSSGASLRGCVCGRSRVVDRAGGVRVARLSCRVGGFRSSGSVE